MGPRLTCGDNLWRVVGSPLTGRRDRPIATQREGGSGRRGSGSTCRSETARRAWRKHWSIGPRTQTSCRRSRRRVVCSSRTDGARFSAVARHRRHNAGRGFATTPGNTLTHGLSLCGDAEGTQRPDFPAPLSFCGTRIDYEVGVARELIDSMDRSRPSAAPFESSARAATELAYLTIPREAP